jgi:D-alanyl-D-alanine carboxypeptidase/D-alanyl-D-alanine-endopeptidase (penicillin-binding protein 4)
MPEFMSSMPLLGLDGTMRKRNRGESIAGQAHVKTGTLNDAKAVAGYLLDQAGRRWIVIMLVNDVNAVQTQAAQDALLSWVYTH